MGDVVVDIGRIHDAKARGGEPLLAAQPVMVLDVAEPQCVRPAV